MQKRVRTLREQLQRRDLHLDLLRKKINLQEENTRVRSLLEAEKEEANLRLALYIWLFSSFEPSPDSDTTFPSAELENYKNKTKNYNSS